MFRPRSFAIDDPFSLSLSLFLASFFRPSFRIYEFLSYFVYLSFYSDLSRNQDWEFLVKVSRLGSFYRRESSKNWR